jgi:CBS domain-containing protein
MPVEDEQGVLVGMISWVEVIRYYGHSPGPAPPDPVPVSAVMQQYPKAVPPETSLLEAVALMRREHLDCLSVVKEGYLVGIVTECDLLNIAAHLLASHKQDDPTRGA